MSEEKATGKGLDNKTIIIAAVVVAVVIVGGALIYQNSHKKDTMSVKFGDKTISATVR